EIQAAMTTATNADGLATTLAALEDSASVLSVGEIDVLDEAISVALNSWEYWTANGITMAHEFAEAYRDAAADCAATNRAWDPETGQCRDEYETNSPFVRNRGNRITMSLIAVAPKFSCEDDWLGDRYVNDIGWADVGGFIGGL